MKIFKEWKKTWGFFKLLRMRKRHWWLSEKSLWSFQCLSAFLMISSPSFPFSDLLWLETSIENQGWNQRTISLHSPKIVFVHLSWTFDLFSLCFSLIFFLLSQWYNKRYTEETKKNENKYEPIWVWSGFSCSGRIGFGFFFFYWAKQTSTTKI